MVLVEVKAAFLNFDSTKDGDIFEIIGEGHYSDDKVSWSKDLVKRLHIPVKINDVELEWTPWDSDITKISAAWGKESMDWVQKKVRVTHDGKKMIISPITEEKA